MAFVIIIESLSKQIVLNSKPKISANILINNNLTINISIIYLIFYSVLNRFELKNNYRFIEK